MAEFMTTRSGYPQKDHRILTTPRGRFLQSYNSIVAFIGTDGAVKVGPDYACSKTTSYYVGKFLGSNISAIRKEIAAGNIREEALFVE
jgi:hypothetical protein